MPQPPTPPTAAVAPGPSRSAPSAAGIGKAVAAAPLTSAPLSSAPLSADDLDAKIAAELDGLEEGDEDEAGVLLAHDALMTADEDFESVLNDDI